MNTTATSPMPERRFSRRELILEARARGFHVTEAPFDSWVGFGLLDQAEARSRGYARGVERTWSRHQRDLLLELLSHREEVHHSVQALAKIPVGVWAYFGDEYVPVRQVKRALETYAGVGRRRRVNHRPAIEGLLRRIARPDAPSRAVRDLVEAVLESARRGKLDTVLMEPLMHDVIGPPEPEAQLDGRRMLGIYVARFTARARFHELSEWHFQWARAFHWWASRDYAAEWHVLARDPRFGSLHERPSLEAGFNSVCEDLLQILGLALTIDDAALPEFMKLDTWRAGRGRLEVTTGEAERLGLVGPSPRGLILSARITLDGGTAD